MTNRDANLILKLMEKMPETTECRLVTLWQDMEETTTRHQIEAITVAPKLPPKPPFKPRHEQDIEAPPIAPAE